MRQKLQIKSFQYVTVASQQLYTWHALSVLKSIISLVHTLCPILVIMFQVWHMSVLAVCIIATLHSIIFYHVQLLIILSETSLNYELKILQ